MFPHLLRNKGKKSIVQYIKINSLSALQLIAFTYVAQKKSLLFNVHSLGPQIASEKKVILKGVKAEEETPKIINHPLCSLLPAQESREFREDTLNP